MVQKASADLTAMMNQAIAGELQAIVQYMWHHIMVKGLNSASLRLNSFLSQASSG